MQILAGERLHTPVEDWERGRSRIRKSEQEDNLVSELDTAILTGPKEEADAPD